MARRFQLAGGSRLHRLRTASIALSATLRAYVAPVVAQNWSGGAMNPVTVSDPMATQAATEAQANQQRNPWARVQGSPTRSRKICTDALS